MTKVFTAHKVQDYESWKSKYDAEHFQAQTSSRFLFTKVRAFSLSRDRNRFLSSSAGIPICRWGTAAEPLCHVCQP